MSPDGALAALAAERGVPIVLMHNRAEARYTDLIAEVLADLGARDRARRRGGRPGGLDRSSIPGSGSARRRSTTSSCSPGSARLRSLGRPILLGASRKSTLGKVLDLPADERLEATLATTALGIAAGVDIVRVHDVQAERPRRPDGRRDRPRIGVAEEAAR